MAKKEKVDEILTEKKDVGTLISGLAESLSELSKKSNESDTYIFETSLTPTDVTGWVSSGSDLLDLKISNQKNGGFPLGKIVELQGLNSSGKSLIGSHALASVQKMGGIAVYIDTEAAVNRNFLEVIGVNLETLIYVSCDTIESVFEIIEQIVIKIRNDDKDIPVVILIDSVSAPQSRAEAEADFGIDGYATQKARIMSKAMRKLVILLARQKILTIFTSQLRMVLNPGYGDRYCTSGGLALSFYASVVVRMASSTKIKLTGSDEIIGVNIKAKIIKNRLAPPFKIAEIQLYYNSGINNVQGWLEIIKDLGLITGRSIIYGEEKITFTKSTFSKIVEARPGLREYLYDKICETIIKKYVKANDLEIENIEITKEEVEQ